MSRYTYVKQELKKSKTARPIARKRMIYLKKVSLNSILLLSKAVSSKAESILNQTILDSPLFLIQHSNADTLINLFPCLVGDDYGPDLEHDDSNGVNYAKNDQCSKAGLQIRVNPYVP